MAFSSASSPSFRVQERINAYEASLTVNAKDKTSYMKAARMCAEFFDARGVDTPNAGDWQAFSEYVREEYMKENGKHPSEQTLRVNYESRAKKFIRWSTGAEQPALFSEEQEQTGEPTIERHAEQATQPARVDAHKTDAQTVRVNFMLDAQTYEVLSVLAIMERRTLTAILKDAAAMYIKEHSEQAGILSAAFQQARSKEGLNTKV